MKKWFTAFLLAFVFIVNAEDTNWNEYQQTVLANQKSIPGWCKPEKAVKIMDLIKENHPKTCVEIGVFGGSSVYPTAAALKHLNESGIIFAIDPWKKDDCLVGYDTSDGNYKWWSMIDLEKIYTDFINLIKNHELNNNCKPMRMTSEEAAAYFEDQSIDILHIDGNHTENAAYSDAVLWLPKVKHGGFIWFDDVNWASTNKAVMYLSEICMLDLDNSVGNECYLYRKL